MVNVIILVIIMIKPRVWVYSGVSHSDLCVKCLFFGSTFYLHRKPLLIDRSYNELCIILNGLNQEYQKFVLRDHPRLRVVLERTVVG